MNIVDAFIQEDQTKQAVTNWKRENRYIAELNADLADFRDLFWEPQANDELRLWAQDQIKSIVHELDEIEAGRLGVPESWQG